MTMSSVLADTGQGLTDRLRPCPGPQCRWTNGILGRFGIALALAWLGEACIAATHSPPVVFHEAGFLWTGSDSPPDDSAPWTPVQLPHQWRTTNTSAVGLGWYRIEFDLDEVPRLAQGLEVDQFRSKWTDFYVNGKVVGGTPHDTAASADLGLNQSVFVAFSPALLRPGRNVLHAKMRTRLEVMNIQGLGRVRLGSADVVGMRANSVADWGYYAERLFFAMAFTAGVIAFFLWLARRSDEVLLWYWISCLSWVGAGALYHALRWGDTPIAPLVLLSVYRTYGLAIPAVILAMRVAGIRKPGIEFLLWAFLLVEGMIPYLGAAGVWPLSALGRYAMPRILAMDLINCILLFAGAGVIVAKKRRHMRWTEIVSAVSMILMGGCMLYEAARLFGWIDIEAPVLRPYHVPALVFAMGVAIFERHVRAVWQMQWSNTELQRRVDEKAREIESFHADRERRTREGALVEERQRIFADMHDGLGASLIGLLRYAQAGAPQARELERRVAEALQELRIAVDALDEPSEGDLGVVLGKLRYRLEPLFTSTGVRVVWDVGELPQIEALDPTAVFAIQRVILEAVSNAIHHASPRHIRFAARATNENTICITVEDDGSGFDPAQRSDGHGLANMHRRAEQIGASLNIKSEPSKGSTIDLYVPRRIGLGELMTPPAVVA